MASDDDTTGGGESDDGGGDDHVCGYEGTTTGDPCQFPVDGPDERCYMHPRDGSGPPEGHGSGSPDRNELASRRADGQGAPEGNKNALSHGFYAAERDPTGLFDYFREEQPAIAEMIRRWFWSYIDDAPFDAYPGDADRYSPPVVDVVDQDALEAQQDVADDVEDLDTVSVSEGPPRQYRAPDAPPIDVQSLKGKAHKVFVVTVHQSILSMVTLEQAKELLTSMEPIVSEGDVVVNPTNGEVVEIEEELPVNLPKSRMRRRDLDTLKRLGILDDPDSQLADAQQDWADAARALAQSVDGQDQDVIDARQ